MTIIPLSLSDDDVKQIDLPVKRGIEPVKLHFKKPLSEVVPEGRA